MKLIQKIKDNLGSISVVIIFGIIFLSADAKTFVIKGLMKTGLYNAGIPEYKKINESAKIIPDGLAFVDANGKLVNLSDQKGKVVFINFWTTWCPPCRAEMPSINALHQKIKNNDKIVFLMVDADSKLQEAQKFMDKHSYQLPVFAAATDIPNEIFAGSLPTTLILDKQGRIVFHHAGMASYDKPEMLEFINGLLK